MKFSEFKPEPVPDIEKIKKENKEEVKSIEEKLKEYENLSQAELMQEFIKESTKQKENGELTNEKIENIKQTLLPLLNNEQQKNLDYLLGIINNEHQNWPNIISKN